MSCSASEEEILVYPMYENWKTSEDSILTQKITKLAKSESLFRIDLTLSQLELGEHYLRNVKEKPPKWEIVSKKKTFKRVESRNLIRDELEILKINMSIQDREITMRKCQLHEDTENGQKRRLSRNKSSLEKFVSTKVKDLLSEIDDSESAKTDKVTWKFLTRGRSVRKKAINAKKFILEVQTLHLPVLELLSDSRFLEAEPIKITCPNCRFFITTHVQKISTFRTKLTSLLIFFIRKMVSASSTSAKNLFVESKLRLSDRVQVNVNNIAAITRQIQRGSKANENLITAAKNFALQEAAIENSETNLKKLKLLTTHLNNQLDSLHNSSSKIEVVLEQVCSMQR